MAIKYPDILKSNNPKTFGIVEAKEIAGHRRVSTKEELYSLAAPILSEEYRIVEETDSEGNKTSVEYGTEAAIGQVWFVSDEGKHYKLVNWGNRDNESGWEVFGESSNTADKLTTARKIGITGGAVGTATDFDGSGDINIPVMSLNDTHLVYKKLSDINTEAPYLTLVDAISGQFTANRLAFKKPENILIEYSNDGGTNWNTSTHTDETKVSLVSGIGTNLYLGNKTTGQTNQDKLRITILAGENQDFYSSWQRLYVFLSTNGAYAKGENGLWCTYEYSLNKTSDVWVSKGEWFMTGWSGWNKLPAAVSAFGNNSNVNHPYAIRLTFRFEGHASGYENTTRACIRNIELRGDTVYSNYTGCKLPETNHMYDYDWQKNVTFPAAITAPKFITKDGTADQVVLGDGTLKSLSEIGGKTYSVATPDSDGLMSKEDKIKSDLFEYSIEENSLDCNAKINPIGVEVNNSSETLESKLQLTKSEFTGTEDLCLDITSTNTIPELPAPIVGRIAVSPGAIGSARYFSYDDGEYKEELTSGLFIDNSLSLDEGGVYSKITNKVEYESTIGNHTSCVDIDSDHYGSSLSIFTEKETGEYSKTEFLVNTAYDGAGIRLWNHKENTSSGIQFSVDNFLVPEIQLVKDGQTEVLINSTGITAPKFITKDGTSDQVVLGDGTLKPLSEIGGSGSSTGGLELGTTETTAFRGDLGQAVYDAIFTINKPVCPNIIKVSDLVIKNYNGEVLENESLSVSNNETSGASITIENGIKLDFSLEYKWVSSDDYKNPKAIDLTAEDGITLPWTTLVNTSDTYSNKVSYSNVSSGKTYKAKTSAPKVGLMVEGSTVKPASGNDFGSGEFKVNITRRRFFGLISNGSEITSSLITGLESELSTGRAKSVTITVPGDKQYVYAFESSLGTPAITNKDGESQADFWPVKKITVTNSYGKAIEYSCYVCGAGSYTNSLVNFK